jgi:hypothetical protein
MKNQKITFTTILLALGAFAFLPQMVAVSPTPDGCYPGLTTAEGCFALFSLTTGQGNTAIGADALFSDTTGSWNTGVGAVALGFNNADFNTAVGNAGASSADGSERSITADGVRRGGRPMKNSPQFTAIRPVIAAAPICC